MVLPKPMKKWIAVFRGDVAPSLIVLSTLLGFWFGLTPGFYGIHVALLLLALVLNINFGIFLLTAGIGKAVCFAAAPVLYHAGAWAQRDLSGVLTWLTAIPVVGLTDVARYAVAGSLILGPVVGFVLGVLLAQSVHRFRKTWLRLEEGSDAFKRWMGKGWIKLLARLLVGKGAASAGEILRKRPKYIRMAGVLLAVGVGAATAVGASLVSGDTLSDHAARLMTSANGAQVDIGQMDLAILKGRVSANQIAATDPERPTHNRLQVDEVTADVSLLELSRGRLVMEEVILTTVAFEGARASAGEVVRPPDEADADDEDVQEAMDKLGLPIPDVAKVESYFKSAEKMREHLRTLQEWLPKSTPEEVEASHDAPPQAYLEYLDAVATFAPTPRLIIRKLVIDNVTIPVDGLGNSRIHCSNLSDVPSGLSDPVIVELNSHEHKSSMTLTSDYDRNGGLATLAASFVDFDLKRLQENLRRDNPVVFEGGSASATIEGTLTREVMDLALAVTAKDLKANASGGIGSLDPQISKEAMKLLKHVETNMRLVGPTSSPRLVVDSDAFGQSMRDALVAAGKDELARRAGEMLGEQLPEGMPDLGSDTPTLGNMDPVKALLGDKAPDKPAQEKEPKKKDTDVKKEADKVLRGLFDKKNKKNDGG